MREVRLSGDIRKTATDLAVKYAPYFAVRSVYFQEGSPYAFLNTKRYTLSHASLAQDDDVFVALPDLEAIFAGWVRFDAQDEGLRVTTSGAGLTVDADGTMRPDSGQPLELSAITSDGVLLLPVAALFDSLGCATGWEQSYLRPGVFLGVARDAKDLFPNGDIVKNMLIQSGKSVGTLERTYFYEAAGQLVSYWLYVPSTYDPAKPSPLMVYLHGAAPGAEDASAISAGGELERLAEANSWLVLLPNGYCHGFYGGGTPALHPEQASEEEQKYFQLAEGEVLAVIDEVKRTFSIDDRNVFLTGNSMGGAGSFWISSQHGELFRAVAPCGCLETTDLFSLDLTQLEGKPLMLVMGTENYGYWDIAQKVADLRTLGVDATLCTVGGGVHSTAWVTALPQIFDFFRAHLAR